MIDVQDQVLRKTCLDNPHPGASEYYDSPEFQYDAQTIKKLRKLILKDPDFLDPYLVLADLLNEEGDLDAAETLLDRTFMKTSTSSLPSR